jgi:hypothetical protein
MKLGDIDKICLRDYVVGLGWCLLSLGGAFIVALFDYLPLAEQIRHHEGFGIGQVAVVIICLVNIILSLLYVLQTWFYQKYLGA